MLTTIEHIDGLGVFDRYHQDSVLSKFERFNILYGMNGSGKTTLSRLFSSLNSGANDTYPNLRYKVTSSNGQFQQGQILPTNIRVFNADYVEANLGEIEGKLNPIFIVGEDNKDIVNQIISDEKMLTDLRGELKLKSTEKQSLSQSRGKQFTEVAKIITFDTRGQLTRTYRKPEAEKAYASLDGVAFLEEDQLAAHRITVRQASLEKVSTVDLGRVSMIEDEASVDVEVLAAISGLTKAAQSLCIQTSDSLAVKRLQEKPRIAEWVERGMALHHEYGSETCEYCLQIVPQVRLDELAKHFNESDRLLKEQIEDATDVLTKLRERVASLSLPSKEQLYEELREQHVGVASSVGAGQKHARSCLDSVLTTLRNKLVRRTEVVENDLVDYDSTPFLEALAECNVLLGKHNEKTEAFETHAVEARKAIEKHHLSTIKSEVDKYDSDILALDDRLAIIVDGDASTGADGISALEARISANRAKVANTAKAAEDLTSLLQTFLGRDDLKFVPEGDGYKILRGQAAAERLSEGEKTAIAFIYFIVQLQDQDVDLSEGIVVIDDPISSLDSNSLYQAFAF